MDEITGVGRPASSAPDLELVQLALRGAGTRGQLLEALLRGVGHWLDLPQLFLVLKGELHGFAVLQLGDVVSTEIRRRRLPLTAPSVIATAAASGQPWIGSLPGDDPALALLQAHPQRQQLALFPLVVSGKTACLLVGYPAEQASEAELYQIVGQLTDQATMVLTRLILRGRTSHDRPEAPAATLTSGAAPAPLAAVGEDDGSGVARLGEDLEGDEQTLNLDLKIIERICEGEIKVPPYPAIASRINELIARGEYGLRDLSRLIEADQALTADILRLANSPVYRAVQPLTGLDKAIARIGAKSVFQLVLATKLQAHVIASGPLLVLKQLVWQQALASALICQQLAPFRGLEAGEGFVCGMLHDFGKVIALTSIEAIVEDSTALQARSASVWLEILERHHVQFGRLVSERWQLPPLIQAVVSHHHRPQAAGNHRAAAEMVGVADQIIQLLGQGGHVSPEQLAQLGSLADQRERLAVAKVLPEIPGFINAFAEAPGTAPPAASTARASSLLETADTSLEGSLHPVFFQATQLKNTGNSDYVVNYLNWNGLGMRGVTPLEVNALVQLVLDVNPRHLTMWFQVCRCQAAGSHYRIECRPFALSGEAKQGWDLLFESVVGTPPESAKGSTSSP